MSHEQPPAATSNQQQPPAATSMQCCHCCADGCITKMRSRLVGLKYQQYQLQERDVAQDSQVPPTAVAKLSVLQAICTAGCATCVPPNSASRDAASATTCGPTAPPAFSHNTAAHGTEKHEHSSYHYHCARFVQPRHSIVLATEQQLRTAALHVCTTDRLVQQGLPQAAGKAPN